MVEKQRKTVTEKEHSIYTDVNILSLMSVKQTSHSLRKDPRTVLPIDLNLVLINLGLVDMQSSWEK